MPKHTRGPWRLAEGYSVEKGAQTISVKVSDGRWLFDLEMSDKPDLQERGWFPVAEQIGNATLIVSSPQTLAALVRLADASEAMAGSDPDMPSHADTEREFEAALAEARAAASRATAETLPYD